MKVRQIKGGDDLCSTIHLLQRFFREEGFDTPDEMIAENVRSMASIGTCVILLAENGEHAAGVATLSLEFGIEFGWSAEMGDLYVVPEKRGQGVSRALVVAAEHILKDRGAKGYQVTVTPFAEEHHSLKRFYGALGFNDEGRVILWKQLQ